MLNVSNNENWRADFRMLGDSLQELVEMVVQLTLGKHGISYFGIS